MNKDNLRNTFGALLLGCMLGNVATTANAQRVVFPQQKQAGVAALKAEAQKYVLSNSLLEASYSVVDGKLRFDGKIINLQSDGHLIMVDSSGNEHRYAFGELKYIIQ